MIDFETKQKYAEFDGVRIKEYSNYSVDSGSTHVKEISNTGLLISLNHNYDECAVLEIFDISQRDK